MIFRRTGVFFMKKKIVFRNYGYRECDSFARFLEKMAAKGWFFRGWRFGMIFEKEAPRKEIYDVEVFPEGDENDVKPEPNTKEYAQYCREAGWELIDSTRKLCVFRKIREDALPIVTERERYENIREAEWKAFRGRLAFTCLMAVSEWYVLFNIDFARNIFSDIWIAVFILWNLYFLKNAARCVSYLLWKTRTEKMLGQGKTPFYGSRVKEISPWKTIQKIISCVVFLGIIAIVLFLADNIGSNISVSSIGNTLVNEGLLEDGKRKGAPSAHTVQAYVNALLESYFYYDIKRFDIKGKEYLRTLGKYYIVDIGLRNYLLGFRNRDGGHAIENVVYFELLRRGYDVAIGKLDNTKVDFIATKMDEKLYVQVTESMVSEEGRRRELAPLQKINDNYEKIVLSLDTGLDASYDGIKSLNLINWLIEKA